MVNEESYYDLQMEEDPISQVESPKANIGRHQQCNSGSSDFEVMVLQLPLPQKPWHPWLQHYEKNNIGGVQLTTLVLWIFSIVERVIWKSKYKLYYWLLYKPYNVPMIERSEWASYIYEQEVYKREVLRSHENEII